MKTIWLSIFCVIFIRLSGQVIETRYAIETMLGKTIVAYEQNFGSLKISSNSGDLSFTTNLARLKTGNAKIDSLLYETEQIPLAFTGNLAQGLFGIINEENNSNYHKVVGTVSVNGVSYPAVAFVRINNLVDKSDISKALLDFRMELDPATVNIPILSSYFKNALLFQVNDGFINQNR